MVHSDESERWKKVTKRIRMPKSIVAFTLMVLFAPALVNADVFYLDQNNIGLTGGPWASVTLTDTTASDGRDGVHFVVDPLDSAFTSVGSNFGLQTFFFNETTTFGNLLKIENFDPSDWSYSYSSSQDFNAGGGFGKFEFSENGTGSVRGNPLSFDVFAPTEYSLTIEDLSTALSTEGYIFAAHIADFNNGNSAKFALDPTSQLVPEPGTLVLLGSGILGVGVAGRKKFSK